MSTFHLDSSADLMWSARVKGSFPCKCSSWAVWRVSAQASWEARYCFPNSSIFPFTQHLLPNLPGQLAHHQAGIHPGIPGDFKWSVEVWEEREVNSSAKKEFLKSTHSFL